MNQPPPCPEKTDRQEESVLMSTQVEDSKESTAADVDDSNMNKLNWDVGVDIIVLNENVVSQTLTLLDT